MMMSKIEVELATVRQAIGVFDPLNPKITTLKDTDRFLSQ
jgi:hypothetical protein